MNQTSFASKIHYVLILCFVFTMPFSFGDVQLNNFIIILLGINWVWYLIISKREGKSRFSGMMVLFISVFLMNLLGMVRTDNWHQAFFDLEKKVSLLIFPIMLYYSAKPDKTKVNIILIVFVISCLLTALTCLTIATYHYLLRGDSSFYFYHKLSGIAGMHAAYLAMYFCFSLAILANFRFEGLSQLIIRNSVLYYCSLALLIVSVFLLAGRTHIVLVILGGVGYFAFKINQKFGIWRSMAAATALGVLFIGIVMLFPVNRERFREAFNYGDEFDAGKRWGERQMRLLIWDCAFKLFMAHPVIGVGTGDTQDELQDCYIENEYTPLTYSDSTRFNAHNQFLETVIEFGCVGLIIFLTNFYFSIKLAFKERNSLYLIFVVLFILSCITESLLERRSGIVFFAFFNSFLFFTHTDDSKVNKPTK